MRRDNKGLLQGWHNDNENISKSKLSGIPKEQRHEGIFTFAIVLLVICILTIIVICALPWYIRRRREKQQARMVQFSWTEGIDIIPENELHRVPSSIIKTDFSERNEIKDKEENEQLLIDFKST